MNYETELPETSNGVPRYVVFSHGFGVRKDGGGGGIFTDIAKGLGAEYVPVMFDYNDVSVDEKILHTHPFSDQVRKLNATISEIRNQDPEAVIDLVAHSQGCIVAALANPDGIRKAVLLAPPFVTDIRRSLARYEGKPGAVINLDGESRLPRTDGTVTIVPGNENRSTSPRSTRRFRRRLSCISSGRRTTRFSAMPSSLACFQMCPSYRFPVRTTLPGPFARAW